MRFEASKGSRILNRFLWVEVYGYMFYYPQREWLRDPPDEYEYSSSSVRCRSFRAFKRFARKHPELKGKLRLVSRFCGHDINA